MPINQDNPTSSGRSRSRGRAGRPADQAPAGLGDAATIPNAVHVIVRRTGSYEYTEDLVAALPTEADALAFANQARDEWLAAVEAVPDALDYPADDAADEEWTKWERRRKRAWGRFRKILTLDPDAGPVGEWQSPDEPTYYISEVPFLAQGIEAQRAATAETGAVHESPVAEGDAPKEQS